MAICDERFQRLQIEDGHVVGSPVAGEPAAQLRHNGDSVDALRVGDLADHFARIDVQDHGARAVGDVQPAGGIVQRQVVPTPAAADVDLLDDVVAFGRKGRGGHKQKQSECRFMSSLLAGRAPR